MYKIFQNHQIPLRVFVCLFELTFGNHPSNSNQCNDLGSDYALFMRMGFGISNENDRISYWMKCCVITVVDFLNLKNRTPCARRYDLNHQYIYQLIEV